MNRNVDVALLDSVRYLPYCDGLLFRCHCVAFHGDRAVNQSVTIILVVRRGFFWLDFHTKTNIW